MDELIKKSDAIEAIEVLDWYHQNRNKDMVSGANSDEHQAWYKADDIYKALESVLTADRPRGEWIDKIIPVSSANPYGGIIVGTACSVCGYDGEDEQLGKISYRIVERFNFCPYCGAKMKGADNE